MGRAARAATAVGHAAHHGTGRPPPRYGSCVLVVMVVVVVTRCSPYNDRPVTTVRILCVGGDGGGGDTLLTI